MDEKKFIYANGFRTTMGMLEMQIVFKVDSPIIDESTGEMMGVTTEQVADLRISPTIAKQLCLALQHQVAEYEKSFGQIKLPE